MENKVELVFEKTLTNLAGYNYGLDTFEQQVKGKINIREKFEIVFPSQIRGVASSFVQGFFEKIIEEIGLLKTVENAVIVSEKAELSKMIMSKLV